MTAMSVLKDGTVGFILDGKFYWHRFTENDFELCETEGSSFFHQTAFCELTDGTIVTARDFRSKCCMEIFKLNYSLLDLCDIWVAKQMCHSKDSLQRFLESSLPIELKMLCHDFYKLILENRIESQTHRVIGDLL
eukprot:TRINITY_DN8981_c0_g1_i1.p1 TRINITY_DN8981_c0_g1~~TRINITY_DN8981_c0_g1_i1.p1  ORF type:complete len:135 (-),score=8.69 TRINITY_DN8981_c0_g1_i1:21-425(-)